MLRDLIAAVTSLQIHIHLSCPNRTGINQEPFFLKTTNDRFLVSEGTMQTAKEETQPIDLSSCQSCESQQ